jgi:Raf kinase inhibitor-like YbhB/YbcL family protein
MEKQRRFLSGVVGFGLIVTAMMGMAIADTKPFQIESTAFLEGGDIPDLYTCKGKSINPPLHFSNVPKHTKTFALVMDDPDAPLKTWQHWLIWNLPAKTTDIPQNTILANAVIGKNSSGKMEYDSPCPPFGNHHYYFRVFALDAPLELKPGSKRSALDKAMKGHVLSEATLMGRYKK